MRFLSEVNANKTSIAEAKEAGSLTCIEPLFPERDKLKWSELEEKNGLNAILTKPQHLSVNVINKYLEFKAKGMI